MNIQKSCFGIFPETAIEPEALVKYRKGLEKYSTYVICMTPRSGSSYLADLLKKTGYLGQPGEFLNFNLAGRTIARLADEKIELRNILQYMTWLLKCRATKNCVFGVKASYWQFAPFINTGLDATLFGSPRLFRLQRRNLVKQGISLFIATQTKRFHSVSNPKDAKEAPDYNDDKIRHWIQHIYTQEQGWSRYFSERKLAPLVIEYDDLSADADPVLRLISSQLGFTEKRPAADGLSKHTKIGDRRSEEFFAMFTESPANLEYLAGLGISNERLTGL
ncbi:MAG: Stf0 family sulfotransferase [Nitrospira sp.]|nr:Stf0 family sulfotransferase [Nitrospira sp.]